jgi:phosphatidylserine/phosphatidylglycerophosphate/cardiolipin synthase-like enzyme
MNYRRVLLLADATADPHSTFAVLRALVPSPEHLTVVAQHGAQMLAWLAPIAPREENDAAGEMLDRFRAAARPMAPDLDVRIASELTIDALVDLVTTAGIDLVAIDAHQRAAIALAGELRKRAAVAVLCLPPRGSDRPHGLLCVGLSARERSLMAAFLAIHAAAGDGPTLLSGVRLSDQEMQQLRSVAGLSVDVQQVDGEHVLRGMLRRDTGLGPRLIVLPRFPPALLLFMPRRDPVLVLPATGARTAEWQRAIDLPDVVDDGAAIRIRAEYAAGVGRRTPIADQELVFSLQGTTVARVYSRDGKCELPPGVGDALGVSRHAGTASLPSLETQVAVLRPGARPQLLFDAELRLTELQAIKTVTWAEPVGVRIRSTRSCRSLRARLRAAGLPPIVIDTSTVLDEGDAHDVSALIDAVRLARTAARMRAHGFPIAAVVYRGPHPPSTTAFAALRPDELRTLQAPGGAGGAGMTLTSRLDATTNSRLIAGNRIEVELDNPKARRWLLDAIAGSEQRVHFQVYMALDDDVGRPVEAALAAAAARGVTVRVLVDSLHGLHGSFGLRNPILDRLSSRPGVEFRVGKPIVPGSAPVDLKQRDHRKLVVVDNAVALLGGRNLSHEYYAGFDEVALDPSMAWRMVPWLDAGARVEGPAVAELERSFLEAWQSAGGDAFQIAECPLAGTAAARVVVHRGLRDAHTVEAFVGMIEAARSHVYVVNGFPLMLEIQHALLRALARGVRVRALVGNLTPRHDDGPFAGPWAGARTMATSFVHSRVDPIVAAGGDCYEFKVPHQPAWAAAVGDIRPHVHAKTISVDGRVCAVGSANLDVTAGYWESELLLVVEDELVARSLEARFDTLLSMSVRFDKNDPGWQQRAEQRRWMRYWPGVLSG